MYLVYIERQAFGSMPFLQIMSAVDGILTEKGGNIIIYPNIEHHYSKISIEKAKDSRRYFAEFARAIRKGWSGHLSGRYREFADNVHMMKEQHARK